MRASVKATYTFHVDFAVVLKVGGKGAAQKLEVGIELWLLSVNCSWKGEELNQYVPRVLLDTGVPLRAQRYFASKCQHAEAAFNVS